MTARDCIDRLIKPGEELIWIGGPAPRGMACLRAWAVVPTLVLSMIAASLASAADDRRDIALAVLVALAAVAFASAPFVSMRMSRYRVYAVTTDRAIITSTAGLPPHHDVPIEEASHYSVEVHASGYRSVVFKREFAGYGDTGRRPLVVGFMMLSDHEPAVAAIDRAARKGDSVQVLEPRLPVHLHTLRRCPRVTTNRASSFAAACGEPRAPAASVAGG